MNSPHIRVTRRDGETFPNMWDDFEWARQHRLELLEKYGECVVLVYEHQVIGYGDSINEAIEQAERDLAPRWSSNDQQITPIVYFLSHRYPFTRIRLPINPESSSTRHD